MEERKTFTYDGMNSADFGLYIAGDSVYDAPTRDMDMITIPGRNGQLSIDQGRFENITVTYPCFIWADTQEEFRTKVRAIRNWLCAKTSYFELSDEYNPESYRLGIYKSGLEVEPIFYNRAGRFELSFDCKPQRFLLSGDEPIILGEWGETTTYSGSIVSFDGTETTAVKSLKVNITPKQSGTGDPSPSNVRPISGWDEVTVYNTGINIWDEEWEVGNIDVLSGANTTSTTQIRSKNYIPVKPNMVIYLYSAVGGTFNYRFYKADKSYLRGTYHGANQTLAIPEEAYYMRFVMGGSYGTTYNNDISVNYPSTDHEYHSHQGSTATAYEPYQGSFYSIPLGQTVYGGVLDVVSGKLNINMAVVDMGSLTWSYDGTAWFKGTLTGAKPPADAYAVPNAICSNYTAHAYSGLASGQFTIIHNNSSARGNVWVKDSAYTSASAFKTAMNGVQLVYELATPTEIQLTPTEVNTLLGVNNIWADAGTVEVEVGENPNILVNPTPFTAQPIFEVEGSGTLTVNNSSMTIANNGTTVIDSEMMEAYEEENEAIISRNDMVSGEFPTLESGNNNIGVVGLTSVKVKPRWWEV